MGSLADQLVKAGLATEDQAKAAKQKPKKNTLQRSKTKNQRKKTYKKTPSNGDDDLAHFYRERAKLEQQETAQAKAEAKIRAERKRQTKAAIKQLIERHSCNLETAEQLFYFQVGDNIKHCYVTPKQNDQLLAGSLVITFLAGRRHLIPSHIGEEIRSLDPEKFVISPNTQTTQED